MVVTVGVASVEQVCWELCCPLRARAAFERLSASRVSKKNAELFPPDCVTVCVHVR